jgi:hypothetical protein
MTHPNPERDEADLKALFDATAEPPTGPQLTKLRARAADVPTRGHRSRWRAWAPFFAIAAGALAIFVGRGLGSVGDPTATNTSTELVAAAPAPAPPGSVTSPAPAPEPASLEDVTPEEAGAVMAGLGYGDDGLGVDLLGAPFDEGDADDLDTWLEATDSFLEDG